MLFREFNIIAAAAYVAEEAATGYEHPIWDELSEAERMAQTERVMAIARGESELDETDAQKVRTVKMGPRAEPKPFEATAKAILDFNGGQGMLAIEKITNIGSDHFNLGLVTEAQVAGRDIAEVNNQLLQELAGLRQLVGAFGAMAMHYAAPAAEPEPEPTAEQVAEELEDATVQ